MTAPTLEAERDLHAAVLAWWASRRPVKWSEEDHIDQPVVNLSGPDDHALAHHAAMIARRTATPAPADVALPPLDAELPPLPPHIEVGGEGWGLEDFQSWKTFTVEDMGRYACQAVAPYAERIRQLERELATCKAEHAALWPAQSPEAPSWRVGEFWSSAKPGEKVLVLMQGIDIENFGRHKDFIRWVDGRTAGMAPEGAKHIEYDAVSTMLWLYRRLPRCYERPPNVENPIRHLARLVGFDLKFVEDSFAERAAAPSHSPAEEDK